MKTQEAILLQRGRGKERLEDYATIFYPYSRKGCMKSMPAPFCAWTQHMVQMPIILIPCCIVIHIYMYAGTGPAGPAAAGPML